MKRILTYQVKQTENGKPLEQILKSSVGLSRQEISRAKFRVPGICVDGMQKRVTEPVYAGQRIDICLEEEETASDHLLALPGNLEILYEDEDVLAVNKPAGQVCHPVGGHYGDTLANVMQYYFQEKKEQAVIRLVGRLDQETSGIVLAAKSQAAASRLNRQREQKILVKEYLALVQGQPKVSEGWVQEPIGPIYDIHEEQVLENALQESERSAKSRESIKMQVTPGGKPARTYYQVLETREDISLVRLILETGRTHQIRVHMAWLGHPLLGDSLYAIREEETVWFDRAALHAFRMDFCQPFTKEKICLKAPLPEDFGRYLKEKEFRLLEYA